MTNNAPSNAAVKAAPHAAGMRGEISAKWNKFTATDVAALKDKDDLISQVQTRYNLDKAQAQRDVDAFANGRQL